MHGRFNKKHCRAKGTTERGDFTGVFMMMNVYLRPKIHIL